MRSGAMLVCFVLLASCSGGGGGGQTGSNGVPVTAPQVTASPTGGMPTTAPHPSALPTSAPVTSGAYVDWSSFGFDSARSGNNPSEGTLGVGNVANLHLIWSQSFNGVMTGQPVLATGVNISGTAHNVLYVGTRSGLFLALDADTGATLWQQQLKTQGYTCVTPQQSGVDRASTFDRSSNRVYVEDGQNFVHALDMTTGSEIAGWPVQVPNAVPGMDFPHGGLNYNQANHLLYATSSSTCESVPWHGRVVAINTQGPSIAGTFYTMSGSSVPGASGGGVWGQGGAAIEPSSGNVFIAIGNADTSTGNPQTAGYGEQVVELTPTLGFLASSYPPGITGGADLDFGATPTLFQTPDGSQCAAAVNKSGLLAVYQRANVAGGPAEDLIMNPPTDDADFVGLPTYSPATNILYVQVPNDYTAPGYAYSHGLAALQMQTGCTLNPKPVWNAVFGVLPQNTSLDDPHSPPTVANGVVYVSDGPNQILYALNAQSGQVLWTSGSTITDGGVYAAPMVDKNLYAVSYGGTVYAFGVGASSQAQRYHRPVPSSRRGPQQALVRWSVLLRELGR
jgi:outer membrane protein assembly factor BamB